MIESDEISMPSPSIETIVAIYGRRGSGKDVIADALCERAGFVKFKFAKALKSALASLFGLDEATYFEGALKDRPISELGVSPRVLMQWFGTDVMQHGLNEVAPNVGRRFWSDKLKVELLRFAKTERGGVRSRVVISDVRFRHEVDMLRSTFGRDRVLVVRVDRPSLTATSSSVDAHESEAGMEAALDADVVLRNDGDLDNLRRLAVGLLCPGDLYVHRTVPSTTALLLCVEGSQRVRFKLGRVELAKDGGHTPVVKPLGATTTCTFQEWLRDWQWVSSDPEIVLARVLASHLILPCSI